MSKTAVDIATRIKLRCAELAAEAEQEKKNWEKLHPGEVIPEPPRAITTEEILADPLKVFNGQLPTAEEIERDRKRVSR